MGNKIKKEMKTLNIYYLLFVLICSMPSRIISENANWKYCSEENGMCKCNGQVRFVAIVRGFEFYKYKNIGGWAVGCTNFVFGDPAPYNKKNCWCKAKETTQKRTYKIRLEGKMASQSTTIHRDFAASEAFERFYSMTKKGVGQWWKLDLGKDHDITKIRIRAWNLGIRLTKVFVSGKLCGQLPEYTSRNIWYEVNCNLTGSEVKLVTTHNVSLLVHGAEVFAAESKTNPILELKKVKIDPKETSVSSWFWERNYPARNALIGKFTYTSDQAVQWWKANLEKDLDIAKIRIRARAGCNGCGWRLNGVRVMVSGKLCGSLPSLGDGEWFDLYCKLTGSEVKLETEHQSLSIQGIEVFATNYKEPSLKPKPKPNPNPKPKPNPNPKPKPNPTPVTGKIKIEDKMVSQSSDGNPDFPAAAALWEKHYSMTKRGVGQWWKANLGKDYKISKIRIRAWNWTLRLTKVFVSGKLCGQLPQYIHNEKWYEVNCNLTGSEVKLVMTQDVPLLIHGIEVFGIKSDE